MIAGRPKTQVAAFFDIDGTLLPRPSLERRFFRTLRHQGTIPPQNYLLWLMHSLRHIRSGIAGITHSNKMYLRGIAARDGECDSATGQRHPTAPQFFPQALDQIARHAAQNHSIVLLSGTLAPLARALAFALVVRLAARGITTCVAVCATGLEESRGRWTGRIAGKAIFGAAKARCMHRLAAENGWNLKACYAYGDTAQDRWMLGSVGHPVAVNPSRELARVARLLDWPIVWWRAAGDESSPRAGFAAGARMETESLT